MTSTSFVAGSIRRSAPPWCAPAHTDPSPLVIPHSPAPASPHLAITGSTFGTIVATTSFATGSIRTIDVAAPSGSRPTKAHTAPSPTAMDLPV
jgi:hypothetical protein